jgi:hypothetical protein
MADADMGNARVAALAAIASKLRENGGMRIMLQLLEWSFLLRCIPHPEGRGVQPC